jgi:uncharacterized phage protein (TIGR02218 family)
MLLRNCSPALALALANNAPMDIADLFVFTLVDGSIQRWCSWDADLSVSGQSYSSQKPWLTRSKWNVTNTMEVPSLTVYLRALNDNFNGGANVKTQINNGLFDGCTFQLSRLYIPAPIDPRVGPDTATYGTMQLFGGDVAGIDLIGTRADITVKGSTNRLDQYAPRNVIQVPCNHAFCDPGCTLLRASFTTSFVMGSSPTSVFVPWSGSAPSNYSNYVAGTVAVTSGAASGARRTVVAASSLGLTLAYPLYALPTGGDTFTAFQGCDKTFNSGSGQSCTDRSNTQNYRGFEFTPPPLAAI